MNTSKSRGAPATDRALAERAEKGRDIRSGAARARAVDARIRKRPRAAAPPVNAVVTRSSAYIEPEARDAMIAEAAYFRSAHRGFEPGNEVDDWLTAEAEIDAALDRDEFSVGGGVSV